MLTTVLANRLLRFLKQDAQAREVVEQEVFDSWEELLAWYAEDDERFMNLVNLYKTHFWADRFKNSHGALPATSLKALDRMAREIDAKHAVAHGWESVEHPGLFYCAFCAIELETHELTRDHIIPQAHGGSDEISNLVPCCYDCNKQKSDKSALEYLKEIGVSEAEAVLAVESWVCSSRKQLPEILTWRLSEAQVQKFGIEKSGADQEGQS